VSPHATNVYNLTSIIGVESVPLLDFDEKLLKQTRPWAIENTSTSGLHCCSLKSARYTLASAARSLVSRHTSSFARLLPFRHVSRFDFRRSTEQSLHRPTITRRSRLPTNLQVPREINTGAARGEAVDGQMTIVCKLLLQISLQTLQHLARTSR
jgi:hypothetical protein